jgi:hypothetical protein
MISVKKNISKFITDKILEASRPFTPSRIQTAALFSGEVKRNILRFNDKGSKSIVNDIILEEAKEHDYHNAPSTTNKDSSYNRGTTN